MVRRQGPQLLSLIYDKAFEADHVMRPQASGLPSRPGAHNRPATGRIDSCAFNPPTPSRSPCAGDVHRFVPAKSTEQQDLQSLHRARERVVCARTALINHMRGLLGEYGVILPQGAWRFLTQAADAIATAELSDLTRGLFDDLLEELRALDLRLDKLDRQLLGICRTNEACRRLSKLPGVGPVIATALVAAVDDGHHFRSGRELAAWIGLVPRQYTTGGKPRLGGIGRRANHYRLRKMNSWRPRRHVSFGQTR